MTSKFTIHRSSLARLVGLSAAYCFLAKTVSIHLDLASDAILALDVLLEFQKLYLLGFSLLVALWGTLNPANLVMIFPAASLVIFIFAAVVPAAIICCVLAAAIVGININSWAGGWMFAAIPMSPIILINVGIVLLLASTARGLKQNKLLKQWEIFVILLGVSWIGLALG